MKNNNMKTLVFSVIVAIALFMTSCSDFKYYITSDKGVIVAIKKVQNGNEVTIKMDRKPKRDLTDVDTYITFLTHNQYNINDTIYFTKLK